jgi:hypothetical protein
MISLRNDQYPRLEMLWVGIIQRNNTHITMKLVAIYREGTSFSSKTTFMKPIHKPSDEKNMRVSECLLITQWKTPIAVSCIQNRKLKPVEIEPHEHIDGIFGSRK